MFYASCRALRAFPIHACYILLPHTERGGFEDGILVRDDVPGIVAQMLDVKTKSKFSGRVLKLPAHTVDGIHVQYSDPEECLFQVMDEFVKQVEPRPTWRAIVNALKNPLIGFTGLAEEIEGKHCPAPPAHGKSL